MIRAVLVLGWVGSLLLVAAGALGYQASGEEATQRHLALALFPTGALLFANLCVLVYLQGTRRLVRRTASELRLPPDWAADHARLARAGSLWAAGAATAMVLLFSSGFPVYSHFWPAWVHHGAFALTFALQVLFLLRGGRALRQSEARIAAFAAAVEAAGGR
ncbi:MAG TPA: hypothetical protein VGV61_03920 [Thermoanaerobaculia bacterium]|nr:hypothetical protein [Thermoanaerobaculia bacterium]